MCEARLTMASHTNTGAGRSSSDDTMQVAAMAPSVSSRTADLGDAFQ